MRLQARHERWRITASGIHLTALASSLKGPLQAVSAAPLRLQDKKGALREEQVQAAARLTELESLLSTNLLKQQQELAEKLSDANVEADKCASHLYESADAVLLLHLTAA